MCKFLGKMFGMKTPKVQEYKPPAPTAQAVSNDDAETMEDMAQRDKKRKRGFDSTRTAGTILGGLDSGKKTLG